jgi:hypothetical protein
MDVTSAGPRASLPERLVDESTWSDRQLAGERVAGVDVPFVTVGGGFGSLAMVQVLRLAGVPASDIAILSTIDRPYQTFERLAESSQLDPDDILRSASDATIDNIWGFLGYAVRQAFRERDPRPMWKVATEPVLSEYFNPRLRDVCDSAGSEAGRLGWTEMLRKGRATLIRRRAGGGYFVVHAAAFPTVPGQPEVYRCRHVHIAVGYPSPRRLPETPAYRHQVRDAPRIVHAYDPHDHVYERLRHAQGTVVVRGSGITASRILQRLFDDREDSEAGARILHVFRTYASGPTGPRTFRRDGGRGFSYQPFNFPKAAFGGQLKERAERLDGPARLSLIASMGGTSTARRRLWTGQIEEGLRHGWYRQYAGEVASIRETDGRLQIALRRSDGTVLDLAADFMVDATGLEGDLEKHPLLADLTSHLGARRNFAGRLEVEPTFEVHGTRQDPGRLYASGAMAYGGCYGPVDSFLGLQYAALTICDDLAMLGFCRRVGVRRSVQQWWRWMRHRRP